VRSCRGLCGRALGTPGAGALLSAFLPARHLPRGQVCRASPWLPCCAADTLGAQRGWHYPPSTALRSPGPTTAAPPQHPTLPLSKTPRCSRYSLLFQQTPAGWRGGASANAWRRRHSRTRRTSGSSALGNFTPTFAPHTQLPHTRATHPCPPHAHLTHTHTRMRRRRATACRGAICMAVAFPSPHSGSVSPGLAWRLVPLPAQRGCAALCPPRLCTTTQAPAAAATAPASLSAQALRRDSHPVYTGDRIL